VKLEKRRLLITGVLQVVGFRYSLLHTARRVGANGWVRNRRDGAVEAVVQGTPDAVESVIEWSRRGPAGARVDDVEVSEASGTFLGFDIRDTV
jgi:acylphosphatase